MSMRSPLGRARGRGSAKHGVHHFWVQRVSAVALVPLTLWFVFGVAWQLSTGGYGEARHWVGSPSVAVALVLFIATAAYHSMLGVQVVIEDYTPERWRIGALLTSQFFHIVLGAAGIFAVLKVALGS